MPSLQGLVFFGSSGGSNMRPLPDRGAYTGCATFASASNVYFVLYYMYYACIVPYLVVCCCQGLHVRSMFLKLDVGPRNPLHSTEYICIVQYLGMYFVVSVVYLHFGASRVKYHGAVAI